MSADPVAASEPVSWLLVSWHFAWVCAAVAVALVLDVVAVVLISRRLARAVRMRTPSLAAVALAVAMRTGTPPMSWMQRAEPVAADYRLNPAARRPRPIPVAWVSPLRREAPGAVAASAPSVSARPPAAAAVTASARLIRTARPIRAERPPFAATANTLIADAIATCRRSAGGETR